MPLPGFEEPVAVDARRGLAGKAVFAGRVVAVHAADRLRWKQVVLSADSALQWFLALVDGPAALHRDRGKAGQHGQRKQASR